jgi:hypothetical protein
MMCPFHEDCCWPCPTQEAVTASAVEEALRYRVEHLAASNGRLGPLARKSISPMSRRGIDLIHDGLRCPVDVEEKA